VCASWSGASRRAASGCSSCSARGARTRRAPRPRAGRRSRPTTPGAHLYAGDLFAALGEAERAEASRALAAELEPDDAALTAALVERRLFEAREVGDAAREQALEGELAAAIEALEREDDDVDALAVGPNDPCPCGSGMKHKRCCGRGGAVPRSDAAIVVELLDEIAREGDRPEVAALLDAALPRFAGEALAGVPLGASLPLLPDDDLPEALVHWALLDCDLGDGTRVVERARRNLKRAGERERALLEHLCASAPTLWRVEALGRDRARLSDQLDAAAAPAELAGADDLPDGALVAARVLELDGAPTLGPGSGGGARRARGALAGRGARAPGRAARRRARDALAGVPAPPRTRAVPDRSRSARYPARHAATRLSLERLRARAAGLH
jgi:hypothetical protein